MTSIYLRKREGSETSPQPSAHPFISAPTYNFSLFEAGTRHFVEDCIWFAMKELWEVEQNLALDMSNGGGVLRQRHCQAESKAEGEAALDTAAGAGGVTRGVVKSDDAAAV